MQNPSPLPDALPSFKIPNLFRQSWFWIAILILLSVMLLGLLLSSKQVQRQQNQTISQMLINDKLFKTIHQRDSTTVTEQQQLLLTKAQVIAKLELDNKVQGLKNIDNAIQIRQLVRITKLKIPITTAYHKLYVRTDTVTKYINPNSISYPDRNLPLNFPKSLPGYGIVSPDSSLHDYNLYNLEDTNKNSLHFDFDTTHFKMITVQLPVKFREHDKWIDLNLTWDSDGLVLDSATIVNNQTLVIADKKIGLFRHPLPIVRIINDNPYFNITSMKSVRVQYQQPFYKKPLPWLLLGLAGGFIISQHLR